MAEIFETSSVFERSISFMKHRDAFTLIELLVVIAIIAILAALLLPVLGKAKGRAQGVTCLSQGKQMMTAMLLYTGDSSDFFPPNPDDGNTLPATTGAPVRRESAVRRNSIPTCSRTRPVPCWLRT